MIGHRVSLASHQGYRGGLDTQFGQTGEQSVYTEHCDKEVMYKRKRNIDNDVVFIVIQEANTPFLLHAFIVVQS